MAAPYDHSDLLDALGAIPVESCDYQTWVDVGMALKEAGFALSDWQAWSARDTRRKKDGTPYYSEHETASKWRGFDGSRSDKVTSGTIIHLAEEHGWTQPSRRSYGWDDFIQTADEVQVRSYSATLTDARDVGEEYFDKSEPSDAAGEFVTWLRALFHHDEHVGIVARTSPEGKPSGRGRYEMTVEQVADLVERNGLDALGESNGGGAFCCINPLDGDGREDKNVTDYRFALVESDSLEPEKQLALIHEMRLPCAAITWSGNKSVHAVVHIDASSRDEYRERVATLYDHLKKNGFCTDEQNKNPSRLTRCPGFRRGEGWQRLIEANQSEFITWDEWQDWVVSEMTKLPEIESFGSITELPPLADPIIEGILRKKQKMLVVGPSKAGKSFLMIELAIAIAEGWEWLGRQCAKGRVLMVNFEIQRASMLHRIQSVYDAMAKHHEGGAKHANDIDIWNLRGHSAPLNMITPVITRQAAQGRYDFIIIDPIYKVLTGDENSASDMAKFCNEFDVIAEQLGATVAYSHHHAKGEAGRRASMDRASGSGVFTRDPDAFLDMSPILVTDDIRQALKYEDDDGYTRDALPYRISYTLREFSTPAPTDVLFKWPIHELTYDLYEQPVVGERKDSKASAKDAGKASGEARQEDAEARWKTINDLIGDAFEHCPRGERFTITWIIEWLDENRAAETFDVKLTKGMLAEATKRNKDGSPRNPLCKWVKSDVQNSGRAAELERYQIPGS